MISTLLIALAAGVASALMFASIVSGALVSLLLFYLAPLPLMVASLGWGPMTAAIGGISAATALGLLFGMPYLAAFVVTVALPAWWLGHLALLGRPVAASEASPDEPARVEWYPVGRLLLWIAGFAALTTIAALLTLGFDADSITASLKRALNRILRTSDNTDADALANLFVAVAPAAAAIVAIVTLTLNLWLAGRITVTSGRLRRSWPDLRAAELPPMTLVGLCVAVALAFVGGMVGIIAQIVAATLLMAYALTGLATLHDLTRNFRARGLVLSLTYAMLMVLGWPVVIFIGLGLADAFFGFRRRSGGDQPPDPAN